MGLWSAALLLGAVVGTSIFSLGGLGAVAVGVFVGAGGFIAGELSQQGWVPLAAATMVVTQVLLDPWFSNMVIDREKHFRFPHPLLLLPLGMLAVWFGNAGRIAVLISVGALVDV